MNKIFLHLWLFALCGSLLHSCTQNEGVPEMESQENKVTFRTSEGASRSFIDGNLSTAGTTIKIYGYHDDSFLAANKTDKILNGKPLTCQSDGSWAVVGTDGSPMTYFWEGNGTYRFFGWLTRDAASSKNIPFTPTITNDKLSINAAIDKDYNQFDFLYSAIDYRTMTSENFNVEKTKSVAMDMNHLFTAFAIGIRNTSEDDIEVKSVKLNCIHEKGSAQIDFSQDETDVTYGATSKATATASFITSSGSYTLAKKGGSALNIFDSSDADKQFYMVWPQAGSVLNATNISLGEDDEEEDATEASERDANSPLLLEYTVGGVSFKKRVRLPAENWEPGKKYYLEVQIADKLIEITSTVEDWYYTDAKVDFSENSIEVKETGHLQWDGATCKVVDDERKVYVDKGKPVEATFCIDAPKGGQWRASLEGDVTAFSIIDDAAPTDDGFGPIDSEVHRIKIVPQITSPDRDYKVTLKFVAITADHKTYPADDMLQDNDNDDEADIYTIVLQKL